MNHEELQQQYALDELLHPEGEPSEWWEVNLPTDDKGWEPAKCGGFGVLFAPDFDYRRISTAPDWDKELSPKEVAECDELPSGYEVATDVYYVGLLYCNEEIWNNKEGWLYRQETDNEILNHFKKRREAKLATPTKVADCDPKPSKDEILRDEAIARFTEKATSKFNAGIREHNPNGGNDLEDRATFADLEDEVIDLWFYVQGLKRRIHRT